MKRIYFCLVCWFSIITTFFILCSNLIFLPILLAQDLSPPTVSTGEATDVTSNSATLNGTLSGRAPAVWFEYGTTSSLYDRTALASWGGPEWQLIDIRQSRSSIRFARESPVIPRA